MARLPRLPVAVLLGLWAGGCDGPGSSRRAESVLDESLPIAADTIVTAFSGVPLASPLLGRRWLVVASEHDAAVILDFSTGSVDPVGGGDHEEIIKPFGAFSIADTAVVADWAKQRLTFWSPEGELVATLAAPDAMRGLLPRARDAAGQYYFEVPPRPGRDGGGNQDSIAIVRADAALTRFDTVAQLAPIDVAEVQLNTGRRYERLIFSGNDWWGVRSDGRLWVARVNLSRVSTIAGAREIRGEPLPDPVLEVQRIDRDVFINAFPEEVRGTLEKMPFAPFKPPFERGFASPDGMIWLRKSRAYGDSLRRYHVVDTAGFLARSFTTVGYGVIVAAKEETVLMAEQYSEGVRLMELRIPDPPPPPSTP